MNDYMTITEARNNLPKLIQMVGGTMKRITITVKGKPKAVVMSQAELESLEETLDILAEPGALEEIRQAEKDIKKGNYVDWDDFKKELENNV